MGDSIDIAKYVIVLIWLVDALLPTTRTRTTIESAVNFSNQIPIITWTDIVERPSKRPKVSSQHR
jgi:hypothetical protein